MGVGGGRTGLTRGDGASRTRTIAGASLRLASSALSSPPPDRLSSRSRGVVRVAAVGRRAVISGCASCRCLGPALRRVALTVLVFERTGSTVLSASTFTVSFLPYLIGGALLSGSAERLPVRRTLVLCDLVSAAGFAVMALPGLPVVALLALDFAAGLASPVFAGARAALLPEVLGAGPRYVLGRATVRMVSQGAQVLGLAVDGLLLAAVGARWALAVNALSFAASALVLRLGVRFRPATRAAAGSVVSDSLRGVRGVLSHPDVRRLLLLRWLIPACAVAPEALAAAYVASLHLASRAAGWWLCAVPAGMVLADLLGGRLIRPARQRQLVLPASLLTLAPLLAFAVHPGAALALPLLAVVGLGYVQALGLDAILLATVPPDLQARALAVDTAGLMVLQGVGFLLWGAVAAVLPLGWTVAAAGPCGLAVVLALAPAALRVPGSGQ